MNEEAAVQYTVIWAYEIRPELRDQFRRHYGPTGSWVRLFRRTPGFIGTQLLQDESQANRYVTSDRWMSKAAYESFLERFRREYENLDQRCSTLTLKESFIGAFIEQGKSSEEGVST